MSYDKWLPSALFLTHYLPDDPTHSQLITIGSLILGQNGIWGDLLNVSEEGVALFGNLLEQYKTVREDITASSLICQGTVGSSPEVYEKISSESSRVGVVIFTTVGGTYTYITERRVNSSYWCNEGVSINVDARGRARIDVTFEHDGAKILLFGVS